MAVVHAKRCGSTLREKKSMSDIRYTYEDFLEIVKILRSENGCPWDREQTHMSLRPGMMEEAAEVCAAIRLQAETGEDWNLIEELGDVLLQVVMHSQIAKEEDRFGMEDVVAGIAEKMVRRHPHVFGQVQVRDSAEVLDNWEEIKKTENKGSEEEAASPLRQIPPEFPALTRAVKVLKKADKLYERQDSYQDSIRLIQQAVQVLEQLSPQDDGEALQAETGNILMAIANLSRIGKISPEQILTDLVEEVICLYEPTRSVQKPSKIKKNP
jgi:tetrapyrrole methylase family protein/MazG family protein